MQWSLWRILGVLAGAAVIWALLNQFGGILFLLCAAVAGWRLWLAMRNMPSQRPGVSRLSAPPWSRTGTTTPLSHPWLPCRTGRARWIVP